MDPQDDTLFFMMLQQEIEDEEIEEDDRYNHRCRSRSSRFIEVNYCKPPEVLRKVTHLDLVTDHSRRSRQVGTSRVYCT